MKNILLYVFVLFSFGLSAQTVTCPPDTDLGVFDCTVIGDVPDVPNSVEEAEMPPYDIQISDATESTRIDWDDSGNIFFCETDPREVTRIITIYNDTDFSFTYDPVIDEVIGTCTYTITTIPDLETPIFTAPIDYIANCVDGYEANVGDVSATVSDNCPTNTADRQADAFFADAIAEGGCNGSLIVTRSWTAVDACGNTSEPQTQTIVVEDVTGPEFTVPEDVTLPCGTDPSTADTGDVTDAIDLCDDSEIEVNGIIVPDLTIVDGCTTIYTKSWGAVDDCGNPTVKSQLITISCGCDGQITVYMSPEGIAYDAPEGGNVVDVTNGTLTEGQCGGCDQP